MDILLNLATLSQEQFQIIHRHWEIHIFFLSYYTAQMSVRWLESRKTNWIHGFFSHFLSTHTLYSPTGKSLKAAKECAALISNACMTSVGFSDNSHLA